METVDVMKGILSFYTDSKSALKAILDASSCPQGTMRPLVASKVPREKSIVICSIGFLVMLESELMRSRMLLPKQQFHMVIFKNP